jgi:hypothetical protein
VFSVWDIIGDHTGAASPTLGNPAADTVANPNAGYMLVINAAYRIDSAFQQTISNLCPNTYYEISCWMRNICSKCGCDSNGRGASNSSGPPFYIPTATNDSSGVYPNLTFDIDGVDYYTTGNLLYTGQWIKKGFTFLTGPTQTSFTLKFFNNAPGGGGNDWALDDISVATCSPNITLFPSPNPTSCLGDAVYLSSTVTSFFDNYKYFKWQKSIDNGMTWFDATPVDSAAPVWNGAAWEYTANYPTFISNMSDSGSQYKLVIATTTANLLNPNCRFSNNTVITLTVIDCDIPLQTNFLLFTGRINNKRSVLNWQTALENEMLVYEVQRSNDAQNFATIAIINSYGDNSETNSYSYTDPEMINEKTFYRIKMTNERNNEKYSRTIFFSPADDLFHFVSVINPFINELIFDVSAKYNDLIDVQLIDQFGTLVKKKSFTVTAGTNHLRLDKTDRLTPGIYILRIIFSNGTILQKRVLK